MKIINKLKRVFSIPISAYVMRGIAGKNCKFFGVPIINGNRKNIKLGDRVVINSGKTFNLIGGDVRTILNVIEDGKITIGNHVGISNTTIVSKTSVAIEDDVMIGGSCKVYDTDFHSLIYDERMLNPDPGVASKPILIKKGAFIGAHSVILKGVTIGEKAIIGAGSVVAKDVPDEEIWAGNPAKFVKKSR